MTASPALLLSLYCIAIALFSFLGGLLADRVRMTHTRTQVIMSFVSGLMLGVAFYHLVPHSMALRGGENAADFTVWWVIIGLISMLLLLRTFHFHQHDFSHEEHEHHHHETPSVHSLSWVGIALGLAVHTLIDGVALGAVLQGEVAGHGLAGLLGMGVFLAILLHKPLDAMSIITVMEAGGWSRSARRVANVVFALMCPLGALLFYFGVDLLGDARHYGVAVALAFSAGAFICIALSDLLPEVHFHSHDRGKLTLAFLAGIALAYSIGSLEPASAHLAAG
ncbi:ZIP family metal transporter [Parahaliea mediterranea]|uniref:ZIP family metal transporter n=1 Tax=Parahaliea mediterranea TaxID=651086 RepID=A0A939IH83_9GAMM|nr:ZIP family metal transporter [Parahaliea mediterranea]MBN7795044.1 ZIP family metal transporter [Parahaliea mediterranea]